jgi:hypothetical protein
MSVSYIKAIETENFNLKEFASAREQFSFLIKQLVSQEKSQSEHGDIETFLNVEGNELIRRMFQGYFDKRCNDEIKHNTILGEDGIERTHVRKGCQKNLESQFGTIVVRRLGYSKKGVESLYPLDKALNLPKDKYSHGLKNRSLIEAVKNSFDEGVNAIKLTTGGKVPKRQLELLVDQVSQDFSAFYEEKAPVAVDQENDILVLSVDGKGIIMREEDLREITRKNAQREKSKGKVRLKSTKNKHKKKNHKRMAEVAAIYDVEPNIRKASDIITLPKENSNRGDSTESTQENETIRPKAKNKRVWGSVEENMEYVIQELIDEALRRDPKQKRPWVMLVDGHVQQLKIIKRLVKKNKVEMTIIIDIVHVLEYLWKSAWCFFDKKKEVNEADKWVAQRAKAILEGRASYIAAGMRRKATRCELSKKKRKNVDKCADYLLKYKTHLCFHDYLSRGFPIASGVIEGACRHLINDRFDITGARWGLRSAEAVLKMRAIKSSGDLVDYYEFYKKKELKRNYQDIKIAA